MLFSLALFGSVWAARSTNGWLRPALTLLAVGGVIVGTTMPGSLKNDLRVEVIKEVKSYSTALAVPIVSKTKEFVRKITTNDDAVDITKWAHFGLFGMLAFLLLCQSVQPKPILILGDMLMLACATELAQLFVEGRGALLSDVAVDMVGSTAGLIIWLIVRRTRPDLPQKQPTSFLHP